MPNWANQTIWTGDCLDVMRGMNSASVDLIYLDPPFNSNHDYAAPIGSQAAGAEFKDTWGLDDVKIVWHGEIKHEHPGLYALLTATREIHGDSMTAYLTYMAIRLMEMRRVLRLTGSIYLHCDPTASHYLKLLMDSVFGRRHFQNEIVWSYKRWPSKQPRFQRMHDILLWYSAGERWPWTQPYDPMSESTLKKFKGKAQILDPKTGTRKITREMDARGMPTRDVWELPIIAGASKERVGYPTQKPLALLRRAIDASAPEGGTVLDPFCGCATACIAAEQRGRQWVGIDISSKAADLVRVRMRNDLGLFYAGAHRTDIPERTDLGRVPRYNCTENKKHLYGEQGGYCNGCEEHFAPRHLQVDHIVPRAKGGTDHISNLQLLCGACNATKGTKTQEELLVLLTDKGWIKRKKAA